MPDASEWSQYYKRTQKPVPVDSIRWFVDRVPRNGRVLDAGAGFGRFASACKEARPDIAVDAVDNQAEAVKMLQSNPCIHRIYDVSLEQFDAETAYHAIRALHSLFFLNVALLPDILRRFNRALFPGGTLSFTYIKADADTDRFYPVMSRIGRQPLARCLREARFSAERIKEDICPFGEAQIALPVISVTATKSL